MLQRPVRTSVPSIPGPSPPAARAAPGYPSQPLDHLDALWIQLAGTLCNLSCTHCFVSCGPGNARVPLMSREEVAARVAEGLALGVKEVYVTGGEPFVHPGLLAILEDILERAPCTVLTNGTLFTAARLAALRRLSDEARHGLEIRVSLDGTDPAEHDRFRGAGTFARSLEGLRALEAHGLLPIVTLTQSTDEDPLAFRARAMARLRAAGLRRPRLKIVPMFLLGREVTRTRGYASDENLAGVPQAAIPAGRLQCGSCRAVTARGVFACPLLVDEPGGRMGDSLAGATGPFVLRHGACLTCFVTGMTCGNA